MFKHIFTLFVFLAGVFGTIFSMAEMCYLISLPITDSLRFVMTAIAFTLCAVLVLFMRDHVEL
jgi:hypothetical protein